jgi:hypothetical protein
MLQEKGFSGKSQSEMSATAVAKLEQLIMDRDRMMALQKKMQPSIQLNFVILDSIGYRSCCEAKTDINRASGYPRELNDR